jgi:hypothetical protein
MSVPDRTPVTRRSVLRTSLTALLAAGAASTLPAPTVAAQAPDVSPSASLPLLAAPAIDREALGAWLVRWHHKYSELLEAHERAFGAIADRPGTDAWRRANDLDVAIGNIATMDQDRAFALLCAHLPGLAPALRTIYEHVVDVDFGGDADCCSALTLPPD